MRTQSTDTTLEAEQYQIALLRKLPLTKKFDHVSAWTKTISGLNLSLIKSVTNVFDQLGIAYYLSGSFINSIYGIVQAIGDIDLVANLHSEHVHSVVKHLQADYSIDEETVQEAVQQQTWFHISHLESLLKIDVFIQQNHPFDLQVFSRTKQLVLGEGNATFCIPSPEDVVLTQLSWHSSGGKVSIPDDKWNAILGVLKVQGTPLNLMYLRRWATAIDLPYQQQWRSSLNLAYLQQWATSLGVTDLLERALGEAGLEKL